MKNHSLSFALRIFVLCLLPALFLTACSKSSSSSSNTNNNIIPTAAVKISGTVATGAAIANATIHIVGANGIQVTATTDTLGKYTSPDISSLTAPYLLHVTTATVDLYSVGNAAGTVNIHPLTDLIIKAWYEAKGTTVAIAFANPSANVPPTSTEVAVIKQVLENMLSDWLVLAGVDPASFDLITTPFDADSAEFDGFLDTAKVTNGVINLNTDTDIAAEYQITLSGAVASGYSGLVKEDLLNDGFFTTTISNVTVPVAGTTDSPYMGTWTFQATTTFTGSCVGGSGSPRTVTVDSNGNFDVMDYQFPTVVGAAATIDVSTATHSVTGIILGDDSVLTGLSCAPTGTLTGTMTDANTGSGTFIQADGSSGTFTLTRLTTASPYAGAWVLQGRLTATNASQCGSFATDIGKILATEPLVVGFDGSFVIMDNAYPQYPQALGMIDTLGNLTMTFYGDSLLVAAGIVGAGACPISNNSSGSMTSVDYGTGTVSQGGDEIGITLTRGTTATVGAIVGSWTGTAATTGNKAVITFLANGELVTAVSGTADATGTTGMERGFYNWNALTGALTTSCPTAVDTNGDWGFSNPANCVGMNETWTVSGNTLSWSSPTVGDSGTLARVADAANPLIGSWAYSDTIGHRGVTTFMANGEYVNIEDGPSVNGGMSGMERGTYTLNASTGAFATPGCPAVDTNGEWGFSHPVGGSPCAAASGTFTVNGNTLTMTGTSLIFSRVVP